MAQGETTKLLTPLIAGGAVIALGAAWFAPLPGPDQPQKVVRIGPGASGDSAQTGTILPVGSTPDHDWMALEGPLTRLREPLVVIEPEGEGDEPITPPVAPPPPIRYLGLISAGEGRSAALIDIAGAQRFISTGDTISSDTSGDLLVKQITADKIVFERSGIETTIMREQRQNQPPGTSSPPPTPGSDEPPMQGRISDR